MYTYTHNILQAAADALRFMDKMELDGRLLRVSTPTPVRPADAIASDMRYLLLLLLLVTISYTLYQHTIVIVTRYAYCSTLYRHMCVCAT
jgi:hypothetical protein